jgi:hypothetical protein
VSRMKKATNATPLLAKRSALQTSKRASRGKERITKRRTIFKSADLYEKIASSVGIRSRTEFPRSDL